MIYKIFLDYLFDDRYNCPFGTIGSYVFVKKYGDSSTDPYLHVADISVKVSEGNNTILDIEIYIVAKFTYFIDTTSTTTPTATATAT